MNERRVSRLPVLTLFLLVLSAISWAQAGEPLKLRVSSTYTNVQFTVYKWTVLKQEGSFRESLGDIVYDAANPSRSTVQFTVQVSSVDTRNSSRDQVLRSDDFFDAKKYPTMSFVSSSVQPASEKGVLVVTGNLTIHGVTKRIVVPVRVLGVNSAPKAGRFAGFESSFTIDRTDFGVNGTRWSGGQLLISKEVLVHLTVGAISGSCQQLPAQPCD